MARFDKLLTPWDSSLEGLRLSSFNGNTRLLDRANGKVTWSRSINEISYAEVINQFFQSISSGVCRLEGLTAGKPIIYSIETCQALLMATFLDEKKPRLSPRLQWPSQDDCVKVFSSLLPPLPFTFYMGTTASIQESAGQYVFSVIGERGGQELLFQSHDKEVVFWEAFKYFTNFTYLQDDKNFTFNYFHQRAL